MDKIAEFQRRAQGNVHFIASMLDEMSPREISQLIHDLWIRQLQLESQTEEFSKQQQQLEVSRARYLDLYLHAPIGYCVFDREGLIREANVTIASQLGIEREQLLNTKFDQYLVAEDRETFRRHVKAIFVTKLRQMDFLRLPGMKGTLCDVRIESIPGMNANEYGEQCWTAILDISERRRKEMNLLKSSMKDRYKFGEMIGKSAVMQAVYDQIFKAAFSDASVFIDGESGTGKELVARTIHKMSKRRDQRFIPVNCGAIPESLFESEFFGHRKGSFTGAFRDKQGLFSAAHKGTLFLDELAELTPAMQVKLLRVLDDGEYTPVGETSVKKVDVRIIAATNKNLDDLRKRGLIREDFFFRIHVFTITLPPLRDRKDDIPLLIDHFLRQYKENDEPVPTIPASVMESLYHYDWPGNVREFQNAIQRYLSGQPLNFLDTAGEESFKAKALSASKSSQDHREFQEVMDEFEKKLILNVLEQHRWNKSKTAAVLGIPRRTLYRKMERYGIV